VERVRDTCIPNEGQATPVFWFGKFKGCPLSEVDTGYLRGLAAVQLSSGIRAAVVAELDRRGVSAPPPPPTGPKGWKQPCSRAGVRNWATAARVFNGVRQIGELQALRRSCGHAPGRALRQPGQRRCSATPVLDVLVRLEDLGIELESDGRSVRFVGDGWSRCPRELHDLVASAGTSWRG